MSDPQGDRHHYKHHDSRPGEAADRSEETAVHDTFPASDPVGPTAAVGSRAVAPERMMEAEHGARHRPDDAVSVTARFRNREAAKLAVETLVREGPIDRRCAEILPGDDAVTVKIEASRADAARLEALLRKQTGEAG
jgi:hypothetical protein